ncbi:4-hydroxyphenylpyruvate dioxygenase [Nocardia sp. NPDC101769]|uniref:4-hydroxyphenylpyruvate dioxygenase n=1 Tax=Nocardia sp. NPDC101769 TaxID=3364333 RepID=UPI00380387C6
MDIRGIDHVEFFVGDAQHHAYYLCTAFGFRIVGQGGPETGMAGQRSLLVRQGDIRLLLTSALTAEHPAASYVAAHGDGVACIAVETADARAAYAAAIARGARSAAEPQRFRSQDEIVTAAEVYGFGDVRHRFVERRPGSRGFLPGAIDEFAGDPEAGEELLTTVDHVAVCVPAGALAATVTLYERVFGFETIFQERIEVGDQAMNSSVVQSTSGQVTLTLLEPDPAREPGQIDRFLTAHGGAGVQHLAFLTTDIVDAVARLTARGLQFLKTRDSYYDRLATRLTGLDADVELLRSNNVLVDRDHWGELFQIFTRSMHVRDTYFVELIDRHGARTFGGGNITALYEAVLAAESGADDDGRLTTGTGR